jgi:hypothetical protein
MSVNDLFYKKNYNLSRARFCLPRNNIEEVEPWTGLALGFFLVFSIAEMIHVYCRR